MKRLLGSYRFAFVVIFSIAVTGIITLPETSSAQGGHGPAFGLATPTGGKGDVSYNFTTMSILQDQPTAMLRHTWNYSPTARLQFNLTTCTPLNSSPDLPRTRGGSLMPGFGDIELSAFYRIHQNNFGVGQRFETTLIGGTSTPIDDQRGGINSGNGAHIAAVTGYASRSVYFWGGAGWQYYAPNAGQQMGDVTYVTGVFGWRPRYFREEAPGHDWRLFIEGVSEWAGQDQIDGEPVAGTGKNKTLVGPSVLGLYGAWGISLGVLFPVYESEPQSGVRESDVVPGNESPRFTANLSYWFF